VIPVGPIAGLLFVGATDNFAAKNVLKNVVVNLDHVMKNQT
jgi:hypothetical protein